MAGLGATGFGAAGLAATALGAAGLATAGLGAAGFGAVGGVCAKTSEARRGNEKIHRVCITSRIN
ncbi:MAG: hypothetical protein FJW38_10805 [Acidobacteria bacterium]|nr:hypothetical protein [Acidobacteriota bacterium]